MYRDGVPEPAQKSVRNLLDNLGEPVTAINESSRAIPAALPRRWRVSW